MRHRHRHLLHPVQPRRRLFEFIFNLDAAALAERLGGRSTAPSRREHALNNDLVGPEDADRLVKSLDGLRRTRPRAAWVDARGSLAETAARLRAALR